MNDTKARAAVLTLCDFARTGALAQIFMVDSVGKHHPDKPTHRNRETNKAFLARLMRADIALDRTTTLDAIATQARGVKAAGLEKVRAAFGENALVHPDAWHAAGVEIADALDGCNETVNMAQHMASRRRRKAA